MFFKKLFQTISKEEITNLILSEPTGQYSRKIWFLYEWLMQEQLSIPDLTIKNFIPLIDEDLQFGISNKHQFKPSPHQKQFTRNS